MAGTPPPRDPAGHDSDPYRLLGVATGASTAEIRAAYRRAAKRAHPDAGGDPVAFQRIQVAFEVLADPGRRRQWDRRSAAAPTASPQPESGGVSPPDRRTGWGSPVGSSAHTRLRARWMGAELAWSSDPVAGPTWAPGARVCVGTPGSVLVASGEHVASVGSASGTPHWSAHLGAPVTAVAFAGGSHAVALAADTRGALHGLDANRGVTRWTSRLGVAAHAVVVAGDTVIAAADGGLHAVALDSGKARWTARLPATLGSAHLARSGDVLVATTVEGTVVGVHPATGRTRWWIRTGAPSSGVAGAGTPGGRPALVAVSPTGVADGSWLWVSDGPARVLRLDPATGAASRSVEVGEAVTHLGVLATTAGPLVVATTSQRALVALSESGEPRWKVHFAAPVAPPVVLDGEVAVAVADGSLRFLSSVTGAEVHHVAVAGMREPSDTGHPEPRFALVADAGDTVVLSDDEDRLVAWTRFG